MIEFYMANKVEEADVKYFLEFCISLEHTYQYFNNIYEKGEARLELLETTSVRFFHDIHSILLEYILLQVSKISDPKETQGKTNLTIDYIFHNSNFDKSSPEYKKLCTIKREMDAFTKKIKDARNKIISNIDRDIAIKNTILGTFEEGEIERFFDNLKKFADIVSSHYLNSPFEYLSPAGDSEELISFLKDGLYCRQLREDPTVKEKYRELRNKSKFKDA
jgi:hypothetical protein